MKGREWHSVMAIPLKTQELLMLLLLRKKNENEGTSNNILMKMEVLVRQ